MKTMEQRPIRFWTWQWRGGGYNTVRAYTRDEALWRARRDFGTRRGRLVPIPSTLVEYDGSIEGNPYYILMD
jgi:hypothetical protein